MILDMKSSSFDTRIDRIMDALLDRHHPFWRDERQRAVYTEAATAALVLQSALLPIVGGIALLVGGRQFLGVITAMMLILSLSQWLIFAVLARRNVDLDVSKWRKDSSPLRRRLSVGLALFYTGCVLWVLFSGNIDDSSTLVGIASGMIVATALVAAVWWSMQRRAKRTPQ